MKIRMFEIVILTVFKFQVVKRVSVFQMFSFLEKNLMIFNFKTKNFQHKIVGTQSFLSLLKKVHLVNNMDT